MRQRPLYYLVRMSIRLAESEPTVERPQTSEDPDLPMTIARVLSLGENLGGN